MRHDPVSLTFPAVGRIADVQEPVCLVFLTMTLSLTLSRQCWRPEAISASPFPSHLVPSERD